MIYIYAPVDLKTQAIEGIKSFICLSTSVNFSKGIHGNKHRAQKHLQDQPLQYLNDNAVLAPLPLNFPLFFPV